MDKPSFTALDAAQEQILASQADKRPPEGKGGHVHVDGVLYRILDIADPITGDAAYVISANEKELRHLCDHLDVAMIGLYHLRTKTIAPLVKLARLRHVYMNWVQQLSDIAPLASLPLGTLWLEDATKITDISPLAQITSLQGVVISGGMNSTQRVATLEPLAALPDLSELWLAAIKVADDTIWPLAACPALKNLNLPNTFETTEYARLHARRPDIKCTSLAAYQVMERGYGGKDIMVTGKRKPFLNAKEDAARIEKYQAQWDALVADFATQA